MTGDFPTADVAVARASRPWFPRGARGAGTALLPLVVGCAAANGGGVDDDRSAGGAADQSDTANCDGEPRGMRVVECATDGSDILVCDSAYQHRSGVLLRDLELELDGEPVETRFAGPWAFEDLALDRPLTVRARATVVPDEDDALAVDFDGLATLASEVSLSPGCLEGARPAAVLALPFQTSVVELYLADGAPYDRLELTLEGGSVRLEDGGTAERTPLSLAASASRRVVARAVPVQVDGEVLTAVLRTYDADGAKPDEQKITLELEGGTVAAVNVEADGSIETRIDRD